MTDSDIANKHGEAWNCPCGQLLGIQQTDPLTGRECLHIKVKDVTVVIHGGPESWVRRNCPKCGRTWGLTGKAEEVK